MSLIQCKYMSQELRMTTDITVIVPDFSSAQGKTPFKTLYLLHGFSGDSSDWVRNSSIERYACAKGLAVVMPSGYNSAYTDMLYGQRYFSYLSRELPDFITKLLPLSREPEDNFVAGVSMGGYGAVKWGLTHPERFGAIGSFSGSLHVEDRLKGLSANSGRQCEGIYGSPPAIIPGTQDLFVMLKNLREQNKRIPSIYLCCGTEDKAHIYGAYLDFESYARELGVQTTAEQGPGAHTWSFWEEYLPRFIEWLPL